MPNYDCGTSACIAGWACRLSGVIHEGPLDCFKRNAAINKSSRKLLGLTHDQCARLFCECQWPTQFQLELGPNEKIGSKTRAKAAVARIEAFIESGGAE